MHIRSTQSYAAPSSKMHKDYNWVDLKMPPILWQFESYPDKKIHDSLSYESLRLLPSTMDIALDALFNIVAWSLHAYGSEPKPFEIPQNPLNDSKTNKDTRSNNKNTPIQQQNTFDQHSNIFNQ